MGSAAPPSNPTQAKLPLKIALIYALIGALWIFLSDHLAYMLADTPQTLKQISMVKGWLYVVLTALLLYKFVSLGLKELLRSQEVLRLSEEQFRTMFDLASVGLAQADPRTGRLLRVNQKLCAITGYTAAELTAMPFTDITHPDDRARDWEAFQRVTRGEAPDYHNEKRYLRKDGSLVWANIHLTLHRDASGQPLYSLAVIEDITARKAAEAALQESEQRFRQMAETVEEVFWLSSADLMTVFYVSPAFEKIWGQPCAALYANPRLWLAAIHPEDSSCVLRDVEDLTDGTPFDVEYRITRPDGAVRWINDRGYGLKDQDGRVILTSGVATDITARKEAEIALKASEEKFRLAMEAVEEGAFDLDIPTGSLHINPGFLRRFGYDPEKVENTLSYWEAGVHPEDFSAYRDILQDHLAGRLPTFEVEFRIRIADGRYRWFHNRGQVTSRAPDGSPLRMVGALRDITDKKLAQTALEESLSLYQATLESTTDGFLVVNLQGRIVSWNQKFAQMWHIPEDLINSRENNRVRAYASEQLLDPRGFITRSDEVFANLTDETCDLLHLKDGRVFERYSIPQYLHGRVVGRVLSFRDVTARVRAEAALKDSEARYRRIVETAQEGIWTLDEKYRTTYVNQQLADMLDYAPGELLGRPVTNFLFPEDLADHQKKIDTRQREKYERRIRRRDGSELWTIVSVRALKSETGKFLGSFAMLTDITERKRAEEALRQSESRVRAKLDSILAPAGDIGQLDLEDIIDLSAIQPLMDDFFQLTHIPMALIDAQGRILVRAGLQEICARFHQAHPAASQRCLESQTVLAQDLAPGTFRLAHCRNHMLDIATPITVGGKLMGNLFMGQFLFTDEEPDYEIFCAQAREFGFDQEAYLAALGDVPRLDRQTVEIAVSFFTRLAHMISLLSLSNIKLARAVAEQERLVDSLQLSEEQLQASLHEKEVMLKEIHHRVKNNLQMVSILFDLQLKYGGAQTPPTIFRDCQNRIRSMALVHESLYHTESLASINFRRYLERLVNRLLTSFGSSIQRIKTTVTGPELYLDINQAVPAGLVANEIIVNCLKHAFPEQRPGEIQISLARDDRRRVIEIRDNGVGLAQEFSLEKPRSFGWLMISNLVKQLGGEITVTGEGGTTCRLVF